MKWFRSLSPTFRAQKQEAQALAENVLFKEIIIPSLRGSTRTTGTKFPITDIQWFVAHYEENQKGFTVAGLIPLEEAFKVKNSVEAEINFIYMKYNSKCSPHIRQRMTKPFVRGDGKVIYFDFFVSFANE